MLEKTLESHMDSKEMNPKGNQPRILEGLLLKLNLQYFSQLMPRTYSLEKTMMLRKIECRRRRGWQDEMVGWPHLLDGYEFE